MGVTEWWDTVEENYLVYQHAIETSVSITLSILLNIVLVMIKLYPHFAYSLTIGITLLFISLFNTYVYFNSKRSYQLFHHNFNSPALTTSDVTTIRISERNLTQTHVDRRLYSGFNKTTATELRIWNPTLVSKYLFCLLNPLSVFVLLASTQFIGENPSNFLYHVGVSFLITVLITYTTYMNDRLLNDKTVLFSEVYEEFNQFTLSRFVPEDAAIQFPSSPLIPSHRQVPTLSNQTMYVDQTDIFADLNPVDSEIMNSMDRSRSSQKSRLEYELDESLNRSKQSSVNNLINTFSASSSPVDPLIDRSIDRSASRDNSFSSTPNSSGERGRRLKRKSNPFQSARYS